MGIHYSVLFPVLVVLRLRENSVLFKICYFKVLGCNNVSLVGDGFCNDESNNVDCNYDGGDCCVNINTDFCSECHCYLVDTCINGFHPLVGNGFCNDETNINECMYDGGDCCGLCINKEYCSECICFGQVDGVPNYRIGDGFCNDETNNFNCNYDGGDCCLPDVTVLSNVNCGRHIAGSCTECPLGNGPSWCNGDCQWINSDCVSKYGKPMNRDYCDDCICYLEETCLAGYPPPSVGDGICDSKNNITACDFDGLDCIKGKITK